MLKMTNRDCENCKHHTNKGCSSWECEFEPKNETVTEFADRCRECGKTIKQKYTDEVLDELRAEITTLQNRCYALTRGAMCVFCKYECEYKPNRSDEE